jgi:uncharacterized membrane protein YkoI
MLRALASRRVVAIAVAVSAGTGIGWGAYTLGNAAGEDTVVFSGARTAATAGPDATPPSTASTTPPATPDASGPAATVTPTADPLTLEEAKAVALEVAPGRVVEIDDDVEATGLRYDVTVLHDDRTSTDVEVDTVTGEVTSIQHDDDRD